MAAKHEELPIPIYSALEPVYGEGSPVEEAQLRLDQLKAKFTDVFGGSPDFLARSPGNWSSSTSGIFMIILALFFSFFPMISD